MKNGNTHWISSKLRSERNNKNISLNKLSERSELSKGLLSKIENSRTVPSLPVFLNILDALEISPKDFFEDMYLHDGKNFQHIKRKHGTPITKEGRIGFTYQSLLSQNISGITVDVVHLRIEPYAKAEPTTTDGYEYKYVIKGKANYRVGNETILIQEGDSLFFDSRVPHQPIPIDDWACEMLVIYFLTQ